MESLAILLIILIFLLMVSYILCDRDMMTPDVLYIAGFVLAVIAASMNVSAWGIDLSSKTIMIILIGALSFISVGMLYRLSHKKYAFRGCVEIEHIQVAKAIVVFVVGMVLFYYMKELVGRVSSLNFLEYITQYIGGSIQLLDQYVREFSHVTDVPFGETLTGLITGLRKLGLTTASLMKQLEFRYTPTGIYLGNVYTALRRYYNDAGWIGVVVFPAILSLIMNVFYRKVRLYKDNTIKHVYNTVVYASLLYVVPFQAMEDSFYINKVTIGYVMELVILYVCVLFVFKKVRLKLK